MNRYPRVILRITNEPARPREVAIILLFDCALLVILLALVAMFRGR